MKIQGGSCNLGKYVGTPTMAEVEAADREHICKWWRLLPSQITRGEQAKIIARIAERFDEMGGFTPEISKRIGWG